MKYYSSDLLPLVWLPSSLSESQKALDLDTFMRAHTELALPSDFYNKEYPTTMCRYAKFKKVFEDSREYGWVYVCPNTNS